MKLLMYLLVGKWIRIEWSRSVLETFPVVTIRYMGYKVAEMRWNPLGNLWTGLDKPDPLWRKLWRRLKK
jgi:hypothetical protein